MNVKNVNAHLHTPYSFSAFESVADALERARNENVKVVGINDFYSTAGYDEWYREALGRKLCPLFNIEMISLNSADRDAGVRVNDPKNPGRTYLSGKGLAFPVAIPEPFGLMLGDVAAGANRQSAKMCERLNVLLYDMDAGFKLDYRTIERDMTKGLVRERHIAKALRNEVYSRFSDETDRKAFFWKIFAGKALKSDLENIAAVENEIRNNLLKAGGSAFVIEDPKIFLPMEEVRSLILAAGGIPTYPFLADDANGEFTDFERNLEKCAVTLRDRGIWSVEFITTRNSMRVLEHYAVYFEQRGFVVTFGSEHNTPAMEPVVLSARGGVPLTDRLKAINYRGACIIAAHQQRIRKGMQGYLDRKGNADPELRDEFINEGDRIISSITD